MRGGSVSNENDPRIDVQPPFDPEEASTSGPRKTPWDPRKIRVTTKPWSLRQAIDDINDGTIDLTPDFQRPSIWTPEQRSLLVESILLGIPLPAFYFNADKDGRMQVVDGVQRLSAIVDFAANRFELRDLEYLTDLNKRHWHELEPAFRRRFHQTQIFANVVEPETPPEVKFNIFLRINTGGAPLTAQEIRHALSRDRSRAFLKQMVSLPSFAVATAGAFQGESRMNDRELALRFAALRLDPDLKQYEQAESVDDYLIAYTKQLDDPEVLDDGKLASIVEEFDRAMQNAFALFGDRAFRKWPAGNDRRAPMNRSLFESWSVALADADATTLLTHREAIVASVRDRFANDEEYLAAISAATSHLAKVKLRLRVARRILQEAGA